MWYGIKVKDNEISVDTFDRPETLAELVKLERKYKHVARSKVAVNRAVLNIVLTQSQNTAKLVESGKQVLQKIKD